MSEDKERVRAAVAGQQDWGQYGSVDKHMRYAVLLEPSYRNRRKCGCGCGGKESHYGAVNGLGMMSGCEWSVRRWVKRGYEPAT